MNFMIEAEGQPLARAGVQRRARRYDGRVLYALYPDMPPFASELLDVGHGHALALQQYGRADGLPALVLHGGPGSGTSPLLRCVFDPARYRIVCLDQRGAGRSTPRGGTAHNALDDLLADLRTLRTHLALREPWLIAGGSWGATLALAHAADQPHAVRGLLLRAAFVARPEDIDGFFDGASHVARAPELQPAWQAFATHMPSAAHAHMPAWLADTFTHADPAVQAATALAWWRWEQALAGVSSTAPTDPATLIDRYRVQSHYLAHACFLRERPLLARCADVPRVPTLLLHGTADRVCPLAGTHALQRALPHARLQLVDGVGHDAAHPAMVAATVHALDAFARSGAFDNANTHVAA
jgi:proline iminopeptidase